MAETISRTPYSAAQFHVLMGLVENSDVPVLLVWRCTCRTFFVAAALALKRRYHECVSPFVVDVTAFNEALKRHGAVISGSVALHFILSSDSWAPGDLDIYVPDHTFAAFCSELTGPSIGFVLAGSVYPRGSSGRPGSRLVKDVRRFKTPTVRSVDVIRSQHETPLSPIHGFWSTLVKNFLTPDGMGCAFPRPTMRRRAFVKGSPLTSGDLHAVAKYISRGFYVEREEWWAEDGEAHAAFQRYFSGRRALVVDFRLAVRQPVMDFPVVRTDRGWLARQPFPSSKQFNADGAAVEGGDNSSG